MRRKLRALDLFCCAGGAGSGLAQAGFEVVGVDAQPQPRYPFEFHLADALSFPLEGFDFVWASPPCQFATALRHAPNAREHENLIPATRARLEAWGGPYVIENVEGAREHLRDPVLLCGSMFGLCAAGHQLRRHRLFEVSGFSVYAPDCAHKQPTIGVYGGHVRCRSSAYGGRRTRDFEGFDKLALAHEAMGFEHRVTFTEISEAIPPAYAKWLGEAAIRSLQHRAVAAE